jgi:excisionase family DNA binding protein
LSAGFAADLKFLPLFRGTRNPEDGMATESETTARLLNVGQAAEYLGVSAASLRKWSNDGLVATYRTPGGQRRYARDDLDQFIDSMRETGVGDHAVPRLGRGGSVSTLND